MRLEDKFMIMDKFVDDTLLLVHGEKSKNSLEKFSNTCKRIIDSKDPLCAYIFAKGISNHLDKDYQKLFNVKKFESLVLQSRDEDLIYSFGRDVKGADLKNIYDNLNSKSAKNLIKQDMKTL